ncbi:MAG: insulinase family protein [Candidatus Levybacteria bacterium]|nr:insulinase family protein [Candidatus Levybacteria bacterium]
MQFSKTSLPNGLRVITIPMPSFESATALVMVGAGSRYENKKNSGISHFLEHMAFKGTQKRPSALDIASLIDGIGGEFNAFTGKEYTGYYVKAGKGNVETILDVLSDMLKHSKLDPVEIEKEKGVIIEEINLYEDMPMRKIGDIYENLLYGDTPMGWDIAGEKDIIRSITREDFVSYMQSLYSPHNMTVVIAGGIDGSAGSPQVSDKMRELVGKYFGDMGSFETITAKPLKESQKKPQVLIRNKKTEQIHIALGVRTIDLNHPDKYPLSVLSSILGGGMSSRLFNEVREKRGLAYYVRSSSDEYIDCGSLVSTAGIDPKRVKDAIAVMVEQYGLVSAGKLNISDTEFKKAKEYMKGHLVLELEDSRSVSTFYAHQELLEKEILNPDQILKKIDGVTKEQVDEVGKKYFVNSGLNLALIGNFEDKKALEELVVL